MKPYSGRPPLTDQEQGATPGRDREEGQSNHAGWRSQTRERTVGGVPSRKTPGGSHSSIEVWVGGAWGRRSRGRAVTGREQTSGADGRGHCMDCGDGSGDGNISHAVATCGLSVCTTGFSKIIRVRRCSCPRDRLCVPLQGPESLRAGLPSPGTMHNSLLAAKPWPVASPGPLQP